MTTQNDQSEGLIVSTGPHKDDRDYQQDQMILLNCTRVSGCAFWLCVRTVWEEKKWCSKGFLTAWQVFERNAPETNNTAASLIQLASEALPLTRLIDVKFERTKT